MSDKEKKVERISVKGLKVGDLPRGNPTLKISRKVDPETLPVRCVKPYEKLLEGARPINEVVRGNRHVRWSVRLLVGGLKCVEAIAEEPKDEKVKPKAKAKTKVKKAAAPRKRKPKAEGPKPETPSAEEKSQD